MLISYQFLLLLLAPVFIVFSLKHYRNNKDSYYLWQRFGFKLPAVKNPVWFHCASVGEVITAIPLIELYKEKFPDKNFLVTTNSVTGANICRNRLSFCTHSFLPFDYRFITKRFLKHIHPEQLIILETEIWPNLFQLSQQQNLPLSIINGRLSKRTLNTNRWTKSIYRKSLSHVNKIYCRSAEDANSYRLLGANDRQTEVIGNLKFSLVIKQTETATNLINRPYVLAASTHSGEEIKIVNLWNKISHNSLLLVIAPRHPERKEEILAELKPLGHELKTRSMDEAITDNTAIYLADTLGEMNNLFAHAELVIMGGSFVSKGGHNILEPAALGKAIIYGPSMENFAAENTLFLENQAALQVDEEQAIKEIDRLIKEPEYREQLGKNARALILKHNKVAETYLEKLTQ